MLITEQKLVHSTIYKPQWLMWSWESLVSKMPEIYSVNDSNRTSRPLSWLL